MSELGFRVAFDHLAGLERDDDHVLGLHAGVGHAARLDDHEPALAVHAADIAPGLDDEAFGDQVEVRFADVGFEFFEHVKTVLLNR